MDDVRVMCWTMHQKSDVCKKSFLKEKRSDQSKSREAHKFVTDSQLDRGGCSGTLMLESDVDVTVGWVKYGG